MRRRTSEYDCEWINLTYVPGLKVKSYGSASATCQTRTNQQVNEKNENQSTVTYSATLDESLPLSDCRKARFHVQCDNKTAKGKKYKVDGCQRVDKGMIVV